MRCISWIRKDDSKGHLILEPQVTSPWNQNPGWILKLLETANLFSPTSFSLSESESLWLVPYACPNIAFGNNTYFLNFTSLKTERAVTQDEIISSRSLTSIEMMRLNFWINETRCKSRLRCIFGSDLMI